jgi:diketogulonate reductase-like aldo/keto reductase
MKFSIKKAISRFCFSTKSHHKVEYSFNTNDFLNNFQNYEEQLEDKKYLPNKVIELLPGFATEDGTLNFTKRNTEEVHSAHFRSLYNSDINISSIGMGTYIGPPDDITDFYMYNAVKSLVFSGGVNVFDTAINYRYMKSERTIGKAITALVDKYNYSRDEFFICSKMGYVPEDAMTGKRCHAFVQHLIEGSKLEMDDIMFDDKNRPVHCIHPEFLKEQLTQSLSNLNLTSLDVMYLHNVFESQGTVIPEPIFQQRLTKAFEFMVYSKFI